MNNTIEIENLKFFLDNQIKGEEWQVSYGERREKTHKRTTVKRWIFLACVNAPSWRKDWFYTVIDPVLRSALGLPWSKWPRHSCWFKLGKGKNEWEADETVKGFPPFRYQLYGMPVPKVKGDLLKHLYPRAPKEWMMMA